LSANEIDVHVGKRMRQRREALGISQGRLGRQLGLTFSQIQKYEKGSNRVGAGRLFQIAAFLQVPTSYFFEGLENGGTGSFARSMTSDDAGFDEEVRILTDAFAAITDKGTRASVLALVRSLAAGERPRHGSLR
jgi:transcriptional regulator with XRE-family HTH domain